MLLPSSFLRRERGYTLLEMMFVLGIIAVGSAVAIPVTLRMVANAKGDSSMTMTATFLQTARSRAIGERRNFILTFVNANSMQLERVEVPSNLRTVVDTLVLEGDQQFLKLPGVPDTPDAFGAAAAVNFTGPAPIMFTSDGSLIDSAGDVANGSIFVSRPNEPDTQRAVTILGSTGLLRTWKWRGVWQQ